MPTGNPREVLDVVNEADEPIATATRREVHEEALLHRAVHVLLVDPEGRVLLQRRSMRKRTSPGLLTSSASGHVPAGEAPKAAARREIEEELGIQPPTLEPLGTVRVEDLKVGEREITYVYTARWSGSPDPDPEEVSEVRWAGPSTIRTWIEEDPGRLAGSFKTVYPAMADALERVIEEEA